MVDKYQDFNQLSSYEKDGKDFKVTWRVARSPFTIAAIHGGAIESGTSEIADKIAGREFSYYTFKGIKPSGNWDLHISSTKFNEPHFQRISDRAQTIVSIHGCAEKDPMILLGGLNEFLKRRVKRLLLRSGFRLQKNDRPNRFGIHPMNICNRGKSEMGLQIEISRGLRNQLIIPHEKKENKRLTPLLFKLVSAVRLGLFYTLTNKYRT